MPKIINHENRKVQIAEATWKVIIRDGLEHASVRKIAKEAGLSVGALRHYFTTQSELFLFSMSLVSERVKARTLSKKYDVAPLDAMQAVLANLLPIDENQRIEMEVWFIFSAKALVDTTLKSLSAEIYHDMRLAVATLINGLVTLDIAKEDLNSELEAERLYALLDGLAIHHLLQPESMPVSKMLSILKFHLHTLC